MRIDAWTFDVGTAEDISEAVASRVEQSWDSGADIVLFPEYTWAALRGHESLQTLADAFWNEMLPALQARLARPGKLAVLGTAPCYDNTSGQLLNRAPILVNGELVTQDKLHLTPWETAFRGGRAIQLIEFGGLRIAVLICLDIEIPELSVALRGAGVDLVLVPSATETILGCERVTRCASARSVELGCAVIVCPLVGRCASDLIDDNLGKLAAYLPSQSPFLSLPRAMESALHLEGFHQMSSHLEPDLLTKMRQATSETNPSLLSRSVLFEPIIMTAV